MPEILFDPSGHYYTVDGVRRPSVTQIIKAAGLMDGEEHFTEEARNRGTVVHTACQYLDEGDLDDAWLEASPLAGYIRAWQRFKHESRCLIQMIEHRVYHTVYGYCGTLDRTAKFSPNTAALIDLKTSASPQAWWALQSAAYADTFEHPRGLRRMSVQLAEDGSYRVTEYAAKDWNEHINTFRAALCVWNFRDKNRRDSFGSSNGASANAA